MTDSQRARGKNRERNPKDETVEKLAEIFDTSSEILKGRGYGLEEIVSLLRKYKLTEKQKCSLLITIKNEFNNKSIKQYFILRKGF